MLNGVISPTKGNISVLGFDPVQEGPKLRQQTGVLTETSSLYERLTARENLLFSGSLYGMKGNKLNQRVNELLNFFELEERADEKAGFYSKGMKQRLALARAMLHSPELLFLDEPTSGLDPEAARQVTRLIKQLSKEEGHTVILCTHNLNEAQSLCNRVAVMNKGSLLALGSIDELAQTLWKGLWVDTELLSQPGEEIKSKLLALEGVKEVQLNKRHLAVKLERQELIPEVITELIHEKARIIRVNPRQYSLEDIYFAIQNPSKEKSYE